MNMNAVRVELNVTHTPRSHRARALACCMQLLCVACVSDMLLTFCSISFVVAVALAAAVGVVFVVVAMSKLLQNCRYFPNDYVA